VASPSPADPRQSHAGVDSIVMPKILVVEDNPQIQDIIARRLQRKGYETRTAGDGGDCLTQVLADPPDLIIMDMSLPTLDGWQTTAAIRKDPTIAHIPIIALTAHAMSAHRDKAMAAGCNDYETKPIDFAQLIPKIERLLAG
jgi:CheY-like chemotaxis protein